MSSRTGSGKTGSPAAGTGYPEKYNQDRYSPVDGRVLKGCDHLAAFLEAWLSIQCGITSSHLAGVVEELPKTYEGKIIGGIDFGKIYAQFR